MNKAIYNISFKKVLQKILSKHFKYNYLKCFDKYSIDIILSSEI